MPKKTSFHQALNAHIGREFAAQQQYIVRRDKLSCDEANRYAFDSMRSLGYSVGQFRLARVGAPGVIKGSKEGERGTEHVTVDIRCEAAGVELFGSKDETFLKQDMTFSRGFYLAFTGLADHGPQTVAWQEKQSGGTTSGGVKFKIQPQIGLETKLGGQPRRFSRDVYRAAAGEVSKGSLS